MNKKELKKRLEELEWAYRLACIGPSDPETIEEILNDMLETQEKLNIIRGQNND